MLVSVYFENAPSFPSFPADIMSNLHFYGRMFMFPLLVFLLEGLNQIPAESDLAADKKNGAHSR